jgi:hypothetical protein
MKRWKVETVNIKHLSDYLNDLDQTEPYYEVFSVLDTGDQQGYVHVISRMSRVRAVPTKISVDNPAEVVFESDFKI